MEFSKVQRFKKNTSQKKLSESKHISEGDAFGFENGKQVPITWPDSESEDSESLNLPALRYILSVLIQPVADAKEHDSLAITQIGIRVLLLAYKIQSDNAPQSLSELGRMLGFSKQYAARLVDAIQMEFLTKPDETDESG